MNFISKGAKIFINKINSVIQAACGLTIDVGSFSDPSEIQGLAHFLEHVIIMGSKKYPQVRLFPLTNFENVIDIDVFYYTYTLKSKDRFQFQENEYNKFIKENGGSLLADTGNERTKYVFQIHPDRLLPAMDRFADIFTSPSIGREMILRERESIDNGKYIYYKFFLTRVSICISSTFSR